jgi:hypothetical protein
MGVTIYPRTTVGSEVFRAFGMPTSEILLGLFILCVTCLLTSAVTLWQFTNLLVMEQARRGDK